MYELPSLKKKDSTATPRVSSRSHDNHIDIVNNFYKQVISPETVGIIFRMNPFTSSDKITNQLVQENFQESTEEGSISPERLEALGLERAINERFFGSSNSGCTTQRKDSQSHNSISENGGISHIDLSSSLITPFILSQTAQQRHFFIQSQNLLENKEQIQLIVFEFYSQQADKKQEQQEKSRNSCKREEVKSEIHLSGSWEGIDKHGDDENIPKKKNRICNCKKTKCVKLYCDCFAVGELCGTECKCLSCSNNECTLPERNAAILQILDRNPFAFNAKTETNQEELSSVTDKKIKRLLSQEAQQIAMQQASKTVGCNCRKSNCLKKYCLCFQSGINCSESCKCTECSNLPGQQGNTIPVQSVQNQMKIQVDQRIKEQQVLQQQQAELTFQSFQQLFDKNAELTTGFEGNDKNIAELLQAYSNFVMKAFQDVSDCKVEGKQDKDLSGYSGNFEGQQFEAISRKKQCLNESEGKPTADSCNNGLPTNNLNLSTFIQLIKNNSLSSNHTNSESY